MASDMASANKKGILWSLWQRLGPWNTRISCKTDLCSWWTVARLRAVAARIPVRKTSILPAIAEMIRVFVFALRPSMGSLPSNNLLHVFENALPLTVSLCSVQRYVIVKRNKIILPLAHNFAKLPLVLHTCGGNWLLSCDCNIHIDNCRLQ